MKANAQKIAEGVYWIGVLDWDLRSYHGYTLDGTTYNAYIVFGDDEVAIIDNAYPGKTAEMMARIDDAFAQEGRDIKVDYIIQNHVEKDHSGVLYDLHKRFPEAPIYCTEIAVKGLLKHYPNLEGAEFITVGTGDTLDVGGRTLAFLDAFLLHWPDSMFTLLADETGILFPNDAFGQHLCFTQRFSDEIPEYVLMDAAQKFYANLITPLSKLVLKKLNEVVELGLLDQIKVIAPAEGAMSEGYDVEIFFLHEDERSEIVKSILTSKGVAIGDPTINDVPYPSIGDIMYYLKGLLFNRTGIERKAVTFGSMGGRGGAPEKLAEELGNCGFDIVDTQEIYFVPNAEENDASYELGKKLAQACKEL